MDCLKCPITSVERQWVVELRPRGYITFFILSSAEHEIYPAHKC